MFVSKNLLVKRTRMDEICLLKKKLKDDFCRWIWV